MLISQTSADFLIFTSEKMHGTWDVLKVVKTRSFQAAIEKEAKQHYYYAWF